MRTADDAAEVAGPLRPSRTFDEASRMVVEYLATVRPMGSWAVTRVVDGVMTVLVTANESYRLEPGVQFPYSVSFCQHMVAGDAPRFAPDIAAVPAFAETRETVAALGIEAGAYIGTPIVRRGGELFGTVCGLNPEPLPDGEAPDALLDLLSSLLSSVLEADGAAVATARALELAVSDTETDPLTGLLNRRGWQRWLEREEDRFRRFGDLASVIMLDLDQLKEVNDTLGHDAGDRYIQTAARTLRTALRASDALARIGGDEFAMVVHAGPEDSVNLAQRLEKTLAEAGVLGSLGCAPYSLVTGFGEACAAADAAMYTNKRARRAARAGGAS